MQLGDYDKTIQLVRARIQADSTDAEAYHLMARAFLSKGELDSSLAAVEQAIALAPEIQAYQQTLLKVIVGQGEKAFADKDFFKSLKWYKKAAEIAPTDMAVQERIGDIYVALGWHDKAFETYQSVAVRGQDSLRIVGKIANLKNEKGQAEELYLLGMKEMKRKRYKKAKKYFSEALKLKPDYTDAKYQRYIADGLILSKKGSVTALWDAIEQFGYASTLKPDSGEPHYYMAIAYHKKDRREYDNAIREYETAAKVEPNGKYAKAAAKKAKELRALKKKMKAFWGK